MQLSIIIVNYNSKLLLEQCIDSIQKPGTDCEIIVADNNSTDGSKEYLPSKFTDIKFILNDENRGFAKACNQGFKISTGRYVLFLNPDTLLSTTALKDCISFFEAHPDAGAVGVRMVDGNGNFLKESKRGFPSPAVSFYKLFGLSAVFPKSKTFAKYYKGHLPEEDNNPVEVLSGAFMMLRREVFEKLKGFDEDFFMYGEDIDLSWRIIQSGYKNYYLGTIKIFHQKGGSTTYNSRYIKDFYGAMKLFVKKHYAHRSSLYKSILVAGIGFHKIIARVRLLFR